MFYTKTTRSITVMVDPFFLEEQSVPDSHHFVWAYKVKIVNTGMQTVRLLNRHWQITDGFGRTQEVHGSGVAGTQPTLKPGESFEYSSGAPLPTPCGFMVGSYEMVTDQGEHFEANIPVFSLDSPHQTVLLH